MMHADLSPFKPFFVSSGLYLLTFFVDWSLDDMGNVARMMKEVLGMLAMLISLIYAIIKLARTSKRNSSEHHTRK